MSGRSGEVPRIVIVGAGPTGLGAARRLDELGHPDWDIYERSDRVGGLASSYRDEAGFIWDHGGHVMFSHYDYVDRLVEEVVGDDLIPRHRQAWVWIHNRLVAYPLQHNIHRLPPEVYQACLDGILAAQRGRTTPTNFDEWISGVFGEGIARHFMRPYNEKVWAHPLDSMGVTWQGERVPEVDPARIMRNEELDRDDVEWGPNAHFAFPRLGTGMLYDRLASMISHPVHHGADAVAIDPLRGEIRFAGGPSTSYDELVTTMPITDLVERVEGCPHAVRLAARALRHTSGLFVGVGVRGEVPEERCWVYFPDPDLPFYRVTYLSNYSPSMIPGPGHFSLLAEISVSEHRPFDRTAAVERTVEGMVQAGLLTQAQAERDVVSTQLLEVSHSYPVPTADRDRALATVQEWLESQHIHSRGRFGAWRYEIGNTDHSLMMGVEVANRLVRGEPETVWS